MLGRNMVSATTILLAISAFSLIAASPIRKRSHEHHDPIKVKCRRNPDYHEEINSATMKAYKYNIPIPANIKAAAKKAIRKNRFLSPDHSHKTLGSTMLSNSRLLAREYYTADFWKLDIRESSFTFGECTCEEPPRWVDVDHTSGYYQFPGVNGRPAIADTGTTLLLVEPALLSIYYGRVKGAEQDEEGHWMFPCDAEIPNLLFPISGENVRIPAGLMKFSTRPDGKCYGSLQSNQGSDKQIYGDILMKAVTTCFDHVNKRFGYCPKSQNPKPPSTSSTSFVAATSA